MTAGPHRIVRAKLIEAGLVVMPGRTFSDLPPCFVNSMPDQPELAVCLYRVKGMTFGRLQSGKTPRHTGVAFNARGDYDRGENLLESIWEYLKSLTSPVSVEVNKRLYHVQSIYPTGDVVSLGEEKETTPNRFLWSMDARVAMQEVEETVPE